MENRERILAGVIAALAGYLLFSAIFGMGALIDSPTFSTYFHEIPKSWHYKLPFSLAIGVAVASLPFFSINMDISARKVGNGQHGTARWAEREEIREQYRLVPDKREEVPGFVLGREKHRWLTDASDASALLVAPPGGGKTKRLYIPSIYYNAMVNKYTNGKGASMILTDCKGELRLSCGTFLQECGYRVLSLNFSEPLKSACFNLMHNINRHIDRYKAAETDEERLLHYGRAERYAKILSSSIVDNMGEVQKSDSGSYFTETSKGLLTGMILLVSEYGEPEERHIISVFKLIIELNGLTEDSNTALQKSRLQELLQYVDNERIKNYVGPATSADVRTSMNVFSSALGKLVQFIDAELEPMVCSHSPELNDIDFIREPTAIFLVCPDSNTTRHFFAALFIRYLMNDLIEQADASPTLTLDRKVLAFWDEFGNMPPIKDVDVLLSAARSRGIRFLLALQSYAQMEKSYSRQMTDIIKDCCQITVSTYVSPNSGKTAETLSKALGSKTIQSGSVSKGRGNQQTLQMMGRRLLTEDEIMHLAPGNFIVLKAGGLSAQTKLPLYWDYLPEYEDYYPAPGGAKLTGIAYLSADKIRELAKRNTYTVTKGQFD